MRGILAFLIVLASAHSAAAEDLPRIDVKVFCATKAVAVSGNPKACRKAEESARSAILANWNSYPKQRKHFCVQSVTFLRKEKRSYVDLAECLGEQLATS